MTRNTLLGMNPERLFKNSVILFMKGSKSSYNPLGGENNDFHPLEFLEVHHEDDYKVIYNHQDSFYVLDFRGHTLFALAPARTFLNDSCFSQMVKISKIK